MASVKAPVNNKKKDVKPKKQPAKVARKSIELDVNSGRSGTTVLCSSVPKSKGKQIQLLVGVYLDRDKAMQLHTALTNWLDIKGSKKP